MAIKDLVSGITTRLDRDKEKPGFQFTSPTSPIGKIARGYEASKSVTPNVFARAGLALRSATPQSFQQKTTQLARTPLTPTQQRVADIPVGFLSGMEKGVGGFTGANEFLREKLLTPAGFKTFRPQTTAGKVAEFAGGVAGYAIGPGRFFNPLETRVAKSVTPMFAKPLGQTGSRLAGNVLAEATTASLLTPFSAIFQKRGLPETFRDEIIAGLTGRAIGSAIGKAGEVTIGSVKSLINATANKFGFKLKDTDLNAMAKEATEAWRNQPRNRGRFAKAGEINQIEKLARDPNTILSDLPANTRKLVNEYRFTEMGIGAGDTIGPQSRLEKILGPERYKALTQQGEAGFARLGPEQKGQGPDLTQPKVKGQVLSSKEIIPEPKPLDKIVRDKSKTRGFLETVQESPKTSKQAIKKVGRLPQEYGVVTNKSELKRADKIIAKDISEAKRLVLSGEDSGVNNTILGIKLAKHYEKTKQLDDAVDIIENLDRQLREQGRSIQAASLWNKMSPEAMLRSANRVAEKLGKELDKETKKTIVQRMADISKMKDGVKKEQATVDVLSYIADKLPPSFGDNFEAYRYTNMLSNPRSHERNIYQNLFQTLITRPADLTMEAIYDSARHPYNPVARDVSLSDVPLYYKQVFSSINNAFNAAKEGMKAQPISLDLKGDTVIENIRKTKVAAPLQIIPKFMQAQDQFFSTLISAGEKARLLKNGLSEAEATNKARALAEHYLLRDTLGKAKDKGYVVQAIDSLGKLAKDGRNLPVVGKAWSWFVPFITTPINAAKMMVEHSLLGLPGSKLDSQSLAKATAGTLVTGIGAMLAAQDRVTWEAPTDAKGKELFYASGKKPFSVKIGDNWIPAWYLGPYAMSLMLPAAVKHYNEQSPTALTDDQITKIGRVISDTSKFIVSQTPLQGVGGFFSLLEGDSDYTISNLMGGTATQAIPLASLQRYINTLIDPIFRKGSDFESQIKKSVVGQTFELQPYLTPTGLPSERIPVNAILPYDIGKADPMYEPMERARIEKLQQNQLINKAIKDVQGTTATASIGDIILTPEGDKIDLSKVTKLPEGSNYEKLKKQKEAFKLVDDILDKLPVEDQAKALTKLGISSEDAQYYNIARQENDLKTEFVLDDIANIAKQTKDRGQMLRYLTDGRRKLNGKLLVSDGVLDTLYDMNLITYDERKKLKDLDWDERSKGFEAKISGRGSGARIKSIKARSVATPSYSVNLTSGSELLARIPTILSDTSGVENITLSPESYRLRLPK